MSCTLQISNKYWFTQRLPIGNWVHALQLRANPNDLPFDPTQGLQNYRLLHCSHCTHSNIYVVPIPLFSRAHIWQGNRIFASWLFCCLCPIMKLYTKFYGRIKEEAINSSVSGSPGSFHIGTGPQGMKGKGHSGRQNSKKGTCSRNRQQCHIATVQCLGQRKKSNRRWSWKKGNERQILKGLIYHGKN